MKLCPKCKKTYPNTQRFCSEDGGILTLQDPFHLVGRILADKYRIDALVGAGGMGAVYSAYHQGIDRRVAVKILLPHLALGNDRVVDLFEREARMAGRLTHENIADVKDAGRTADGIAYLVMEWLEGRTLEEELAANGALSLERTAGLLKQITAALEEAHAAHIIHRDLKPSNIMLVRRGNRGEQVKVLDFGIGKIASDTGGASVSALMGTPHYASPEQFELGGRIDGRTDIYSLGVVLFQLLTGKLPFDAPSVHELIKLHLTATPPPLRTIQPDIPVAIEQLVSDMLSKQPDLRPQQVTEVYERFSQALTTAGIEPSATVSSSFEAVRAEKIESTGFSTVSEKRESQPEVRPPVTETSKQTFSEQEPLLFSQTVSSFTDSKPKSYFKPALAAAIAVLGLGGGYAAYQQIFTSDSPATLAESDQTTIASPAPTTPSVTFNNGKIALGSPIPMPTRGKAEKPTPSPTVSSSPRSSPTSTPESVTTGGVPGGVMGGVVGGTDPPASQEKKRDADRPKTLSLSGGVLQGSAIRKVQPDYPAIAKAARASGAVQVAVTIDEDGNVTSASAVSGHPLLREAAVQAARQWKFKPTELSGVPVKVQGILTFNFTLQ